MNSNAVIPENEPLLNDHHDPLSSDLPDSQHDLDRMQPEEAILDLPDVKDIPGQEHIVVPPLGALSDTTISSDDEEGIGIFDDDDEEDKEIIMGSEADVTQGEIGLLQRTDEDMPTEDNNRLRDAALDDQDFEGERLNEGSLATDVSGDDLDITGTDGDDASLALGNEDEENDIQSLGSDNNDK